MNINKALLVLENKYISSKSKEEENIYSTIKEILICLSDPCNHEYETWPYAVQSHNGIWHKCSKCDHIKFTKSKDAYPYEVKDISTERAYNAGVVATYELFASIGKDETWKKITNYCFKDFIK